MKYSKSILFLSSLFLITILVTQCKKETEPVKTEKEILTLALTNDVRADSLREFVMWMENMGTRFALADNHRNVAVKIKNKFIQLGYTDTKLDSFWIVRTYKNILYEQWQYNIIATLEGSTNPDSICILGGHYDNTLKSTTTGDPLVTAYGANDNASGVAAALEVARVMKKNNYSPKNTIKFVAFGAEELGLLGSYNLAQKSYNNNDKIKMMLNNDMIAYEPATDKKQWWADIMDYPISVPLRVKAQDITDHYTVLNSVNVNTYNKQSDSYPYSQYGFKSLFFFGYASDPNYHTLNDISANCNFEFCREVVNISVALLVDMN